MKTLVDSLRCGPRTSVRELVCGYRPARDRNGRVVRVPSVPLKNPHDAARVLAPLIACEPVEVFATVCLGADHRLLAWHLVSRGTRHSTSVSMPDVFLPVCVTPGAVALIVAHNHPSGDPKPSVEDIALTARLKKAAGILELSLLDHVIFGDEGRYFSFRQAGLLGDTPAAG